MIGVSVILPQRLSAREYDWFPSWTHILLLESGTIISIVVVLVIHRAFISALGMSLIYHRFLKAILKGLLHTYWIPNPTSFDSRYAPR